MDIPYLRPDSLMSLEAQKKILRARGFSDEMMEDYVETDNAKQPRLNWIINDKMRDSHHDNVVPAHLHRLCSRSDGLAEFIERITNRNGTVEDGDTGVRSDDAARFPMALVEAVCFLSGRLTPSERRKRAKLGAAASPVSTYATGHMPLRDMEEILNDRSLRLDEAIKSIQADDRYERKMSRDTILRWMREGRLHVKSRKAGPKRKRGEVSSETRA